MLKVLTKPQETLKFFKKLNTSRHVSVGKDTKNHCESKSPLDEFTDINGDVIIFSSFTYTPEEAVRGGIRSTLATRHICELPSCPLITNHKCENYMI